MVRRSVADDSYGRAPFAGAIELGKIHTLPCAQRDGALAYREGHAVADQDRLDVSRAVSFGVFVFRSTRDHSLKRALEVFLHIGVRVLIHEDRRGRVGDAHGHDSVSDLRACDRDLHAGGDVDRFLAPLCLDGDRFVPNGHARAASASRSAAILSMSAAVAFPPLTTRTVRRPRGSTFLARTAASGAAPDGSTSSGSASRYSYQARSRSASLTVTKSST